MIARASLFARGATGANVFAKPAGARPGRGGRHQRRISFSRAGTARSHGAAFPGWRSPAHSHCVIRPSNCLRPGRMVAVGSIPKSPKAGASKDGGRQWRGLRLSLGAARAPSELADR
jgi:hypothetical protein